jgi:hypothetical protein
MAFPWTELGAVATAAGAGAAWLAATASREAVARTHRPFVWPEWVYEPSDDSSEPWEWRVRLHNDGPGVALDVRWSVRVMFAPPHLSVYPEEEVRAKAEEETRRRASDPIRGLRPGESWPHSGWLTGTSPPGDIEWIAVRFTDSAGVRWEYNEPLSEGLADPPRRLRKVRRRRSLQWRLRRLRDREWREAVPIRERPDW